MIPPQIWIMALVLGALVLAFGGAALWVRRIADRAQLEQRQREEAVRVAAEHRRKHGPRYLKVVYGGSSSARMRLEGSADGVNFSPLDPGGADPANFDRRFKLVGPPTGDGVRIAEAIEEPMAACADCGDPVDAIGYTLCKRCRDLEDAYSGNVE